LVPKRLFNISSNRDFFFLGGVVVSDAPLEGDVAPGATAPCSDGVVEGAGVQGVGVQGATAPCSVDGTCSGVVAQGATAPCSGVGAFFGAVPKRASRNQIFFFGICMGVKFTNPPLATTVV
jgi:hypothetical protein